MNETSYEILKVLIAKYDYGAAIEQIEKIEDGNELVKKLLFSCKHAINFDFQSAYYELYKVDEGDKKIENLKNNLQELIAGKPEAIFSELIENTRIQLENRRYIDFLSRVYRLKEAILKYIFVRNHVDKNKFSFMNEIISKRMIIRILRKKYKIFNPNLSFAISSYINKYLNKDKRYQEALEILNSNKMNEVIELRHDCIAGHGFKGVNRKEFMRIYGNPDSIIDDFCIVLDKIGVSVSSKKYDKINGYILELLQTVNT